MRWALKQPANIGDHRWNIKYAWLPTRASKQNANDSSKWYRYIIWLEYYDCHEEYKTVTEFMWDCPNPVNKWVHEGNYVLDPIIK